MRLRPAAPIAVLLLNLVGCPSGGSDADPESPDDGSEVVSEHPEPPATEEPADPTTLASEFVGRWRLSGYTLDDGTSKTVPNEVVGAFLDVYGYVGDDVTVERAIETPDGLEVGIRYRELIGGDPTLCATGDAPSGPYVLVAVESIAQPSIFAERTVATRSGVETAQFEEVP